MKRVCVPVWVVSVVVGLFAGWVLGTVAYFWFLRDWLR
jgi:hypothetical protein